MSGSVVMPSSFFNGIFNAMLLKPFFQNGFYCYFHSFDGITAAYLDYISIEEYDLLNFKFKRVVDHGND